jgi:RNA polymerase sigma-70 factor (ECF subfamily)
LAATPATGVAAVTGPSYPADSFLSPDDAQWPGHWARPPSPWQDVIPPEVLHSDGMLDEVRMPVAELPQLHRRVLVLRDIEGRDQDEISDSLDLDADDVRWILHAARLHVRAHLDRVVSEDRGG